MTLHHRRPVARAAHAPRLDAARSASTVCPLPGLCPWPRRTRCSGQRRDVSFSISPHARQRPCSCAYAWRSARGSTSDTTCTTGGPRQACACRTACTRPRARVPPRSRSRVPWQVLRNARSGGALVTVCACRSACTAHLAHAAYEQRAAHGGTRCMSCTVYQGPGVCSANTLGAAASCAGAHVLALLCGCYC